jgi:cytochrome c oxidase cbb3-type subunit III
VRFTVLLTASACLVAAIIVNSSTWEGRLLRSDPNAVPSNAALMGFALLRGEMLFGAHCATCHGLQGQGDPARGIPVLSDGDWLYGTGSVSDIEQVIQYGIRSYHPKSWNLAIMPAYGTPRPSARDANISALTPGNIRDLVEFLMREQGHGADTAAATRGAQLFVGAGGCYDCHASDGKGDSAIGAANLTDGITLYGDGSRKALTMSISQGRHGVCPAWVARLRPAEIREIAVFVYSLSHAQSGATSVAIGREIH